MKNTQFLHFSNTDHARNSASAVLDSYMNTLTMSEWAKNSAHAAQMNSIDNAFTTGRVYSVDTVDGGRFYTDTNLAGNMFIGTQNSLGGFAGSLQIAGLIAHEGTHWYQYQNQIDPRSEQSELAAHAAQQAVMNNSASHTLSAGEIQQIQVDYEFAKPETLEQYTYNPAGEPDLTSDSAATGNSGTGDNGLIAQEGSFAASHPELDFGDGSLKDNPNTGTYVSQYYYSVYGEYPTETQLEAMVQAITHYAHTLPENAFDGNYTALCRSVVESGVQPDGYADGVKDGAENQTGDGSQTEPAQMPYAAAQSSRPTGAGNSGNGGGENSVNTGWAEDIALKKCREILDGILIGIFKNDKIISGQANDTNLNKIKAFIDEFKKYKDLPGVSSILERAEKAYELLRKEIVNNKIKKMMENRWKKPANIDRILSGQGTFMINANSETQYEVDRNIGLLGEVDGVSSFQNGTSIIAQLNLFADNNIKLKRLVLVGHSTGQNLWSEGAGTPVQVSDIARNVNLHNTLTKDSTVIFGQCKGSNSVENFFSEFKNKFLNQDKYLNNPELGKKEFTEKFKGLTIWGRNYNASFDGNAAKYANIALSTFLSLGQLPIWIKHTVNSNGELTTENYPHPASKHLLKMQQIVPQDFRKDIKVYYELLNSNSISPEFNRLKNMLSQQPWFSEWGKLKDTFLNEVQRRHYPIPNN